MSTRRNALACAVVGFSMIAGTATAQVFTVSDDPVFFSWSITRTDEDPIPTIPSGTTLSYTFCPHQGCPGPGFGTIHQEDVNYTLNEMVLASKPVAILLREHNVPWGSGPTWASTVDYPVGLCSNGTLRPEQLAFGVVDRHLESGGQLNYVLGDVEGGPSLEDLDTIFENIEDIVTGAFSGGVTGDPWDTGTPVNVSQATIQGWDTVYYGNYNFHRRPESGTPGVYIDITALEANKATNAAMQARHNIFVDRGLNVLMPVCYMRANHILHTVDHWDADSPTVRHAYMWSPIESFSMGVREELAEDTMDGKKVIPWVCPFLDGHGAEDPQDENEFEGCWMPPAEDYLALIKHLRLRGADGFYYFNNPGLDPGQSFEQTFWSAEDGEGDPLNPWFDENAEWADSENTPNGDEWFETNSIISWEELDDDLAPTSVVYHLENDKESGIIVSAVNGGGRLRILVSYMKEAIVSPYLDMDQYFPAARDYSGVSPTEYLAISSFAHIYTSDFFTPDIDGDGDADATDITLFYLNWSNEIPIADWNQDSFVDSEDSDLFDDAYDDFNS